MNTAVITEPSQKAKSPRLREEFARWMKMKGKSENTIRDYIADVLDFVMFSGRRDPRTLGRLNDGLNHLWTYETRFRIR